VAKKTKKAPSRKSTRPTSASSSKGKKKAASGSAKSRSSRASTSRASGSGGASKKSTAASKKTTRKKTSKKTSKKTGGATKKTTRAGGSKSTARKKAAASSKGKGASRKKVASAGSGAKKKSCGGTKAASEKSSSSNEGSASKSAGAKSSAPGVKPAASSKKAPRKTTGAAQRRGNDKTRGADPGSLSAAQAAARKLAAAAGLRPVETVENDLVAPAESADRLTKSPLSKREINKYRKMLEEKRAEVAGDVEDMESEALGRGEGGSLSHMPQHLADHGSDEYDQSLALGIAASQRDLLREIDAALQRIDEGVYGICEVMGTPINQDRLEATPWTRVSVEGARLLDRRRYMP